MQLKKGPTLHFLKKDGTTFTKRFNSISSAKRAIKGWRNAGGHMSNRVKKTKYNDMRHLFN